jgi:diguanylate cyclase (GGDEF)-like protein
VENKKTLLKYYSLLVLVLAVLVSVYSCFILRFEKLDIYYIAVLTGTILLGAFINIQLPRTKIHLSFAEAAIFYTILVYGTGAAVFLGALESLFSAYSLRRKNITISTQTIFINAANTVIATFAAGLVAGQIFPRVFLEHNFEDKTELALALSLVCLLQFFVNSILVAVITSLKSEKPVWRVLYENCLTVLIMYAAAAATAGLVITALENVSTVLLSLASLVAAVAYLTYRRFVDDVKETTAKAEIAERKRAEQAEKHVLELQHYISELEASTRALKESERKLRYTAFFDTLTGLPNRNKFLERLQFFIEKSKYEPQFKFAVLHLNLNRFKTINDSLGHSTGNLLLQNVAKRLSNLIEDGDLAARFGRDEFAIILVGVSRLDQIFHFAEKLNHKLSEPYTLESRQVFTSASIGIAVNAQHYDNAEDLLRDANIAMYHAKVNEMPYAVFDQNMHIKAVTRLQLETDLRYAIERGEFRVYYQPILNLNTIELMGFEALMRWQHPQRGLVPPSEFIPVSETTGLIVPMSLWILRKSCEKLVEWQNTYPGTQNLVISVNLSSKHFAHPDMVEQIQRIIRETGVNVKCLKLEITESAVMENAENAIRMLKQLRQLGLQLSIDDFGTGYSSLSYLHRFPINMLKVDRSFVRSMEAGSENGEIVRTIIALAKSLKLSVIAEGIESIHQLHQLRILECEYGQGYLFSRPVPEEEAERLLTDSGRWRSILPHRKNEDARPQNDFSLLDSEQILPESPDLIQ